MECSVRVVVQVSLLLVCILILLPAIAGFPSLSPATAGFPFPYYIRSHACTIQSMNTIQFYQQCFRSLSLSLSHSNTLTGVDGYPKGDLVTRLPGQPKVEFSQYAGYVDIDVKHGRSLFYYFVEADHDPQNKPLTLWNSGGPGCSSIRGGAFTELGPFYPIGDGRSLRRNSMSWNKASNLLFVESPAGTGHFIPQLTNAMLDYNAHSTGFKFNVKGVAIGNPLLKANRDVQAKYEYFWSHGMISDEIYLAIKNDCDFGDADSGSKSCMNDISEAEIIAADHIDHDDVILDVCDPSIVEQELRLKKMATKIGINVDVCMSYERDFYFNLPEVQKVLHTNRTNLTYKWSICTLALNYSLTDPYVVAYSQPSRALHLFSSFVSGRRLPNTTRPSIDE